jgi:spermidine/putrescine transport system permease protein
MVAGQVAAGSARPHGVAARSTRGGDNWIGTILVAPALLWIIATVMAPIAILVFYSLFSLQGNSVGSFTLDNYTHLTDPAFRALWVRTALMVVAVSSASLVIGVPVAYNLSVRSRHTELWLALLLLPYLVGYIPRILALRSVLGVNGLVGAIVGAFGASRDVVRPLLFSDLSTFIGLSYLETPVMIVLVYLAMERIDRRILDASSDLGAGPAETFFRVLLPNVRAGMLGGLVLVAAATFGSFAEPSLLGGASGQTLGTITAEQLIFFFAWGRASALAVTSILGIALVAGVAAFVVRITVRTESGR